MTIFGQYNLLKCEQRRGNCYSIRLKGKRHQINHDSCKLAKIRGDTALGNCHVWPLHRLSISLRRLDSPLNVYYELKVLIHLASIGSTQVGRQPAGIAGHCVEFASLIPPLPGLA